MSTSTKQHSIADQLKDEKELVRATYFGEYSISQDKVNIFGHVLNYVKVLSVSVNEDKTLIGFTSYDKEENKYFANIIENPLRCLSFHEKLHNDYPSFQFLRGKGTSAMLFIRDEKIEVYNVYFKGNNESQKITAHPHLKHKVTENFRWFEYDSKNEILYAIIQKPKQNNGRDTYYEFVVFHFKDKKPELIYKTHLDISLELNQYMYSKDHISVIRFKENVDSYCICHQHYSEDKSRIRISIFVLYHYLKISYTIPIERKDRYCPSKVIFDRIGDLLVIYLPNHFIHILECSVDHHPLLSLKLSGEEATRFFDETQKRPYVVVSRLLNNEGRNTLIEKTTNTLYEYDINENFLYKILDLNDPDVDIQVLLIALLHKRDTKLALGLVKKITKERPKTASSKLFKQFLLGALLNETLLFFMRIEEAPLEKLSSYLPLPTTPLPLEKLLEIGAEIEDIEIGNFENVSQDKMKKRDRIDLSTIDWKSSDKERITQSSFRRKLVSFFKGEDYQSLNMNQDNSKCTDPLRNELISAYYEHIFEPMSKEIKISKGLYFWSHEFRNIQSILSDMLYQSIVDTINDLNTSDAFRLLSQFHCAIEDLLLPIPVDFPTHFTLLGYKALPRHLFVQYLENQVFYVTKSFVKNEILTPKNIKEDIAFIQLILSYLSESESIELIKEYHLDNDYIIENLLSKGLECNNVVDIEDLLDSEFLPSSIYLKTVNENLGEEDYNLIEEVIKQKYLNMFQLCEIKNNEY